MLEEPADFEALKASGVSDFMQVPTVELPSGRVLCQTFAIVRYAAAVGGLDGGADPLDRYAVDEVIEGVRCVGRCSAAAARPMAHASACVCVVRRDWAPIGVGYCWMPDAEARAELVAEKHARFLPCFDALARKNGARGCFVGDGVTMADVVFAEGVQQFHDCVGSTAWLAAYPALEAIHARVVALPQVKAFLDDPKLRFPVQDDAYKANVNHVLGR